MRLCAWRVRILATLAVSLQLTAQPAQPARTETLTPSLVPAAAHNTTTTLS